MIFNEIPVEDRSQMDLYSWLPFMLRGIVFMSCVLPSVCPSVWLSTWWRHQMETFSALLDICAGNSPVPGEFTAQRPVTRSFDVFFDLCLNKRLSKQSWGWWFETLLHPLWCHSNDSEWHYCTTSLSIGLKLVMQSSMKQFTNGHTLAHFVCFMEFKILHDGLGGLGWCYYSNSFEI